MATAAVKTAGNGKGRFSDLLDPVARALGLVALALPALGFLVRLLNYWMHGLYSPTRLALGASIPALAARGASVVAGPLVVALIIITLSRPTQAKSSSEASTDREKGFPWLFCVMGVAGLVALSITSLPGGTIDGLGGGLGGFLGGRAVQKEGQLTVTALLPAMVVLLVTGITSSVISPNYAKASFYEIADGHTETGWYVELGKGDDGLYLHSCKSDDSNGWVVVPLGHVDDVVVDNSYVSAHPTTPLWRWVISRPSIDSGLQFDCPHYGSPPAELDE